MKNSTPYILFICIGLAISSCRCKDDNKPCSDPTNPKCENYDPCYGRKTINTNFRVRPGDNGFKPPGEWCVLEPTDTFFASSVRFDMPFGNPKNCVYEWQIGTEPTPRIGNGLEIDFSSYLNAGKWESAIAVSLTIRTPQNECLTNKTDTLKTEIRNLFFTKKYKHNLASRDSVTKYKGSFSHEKGIERTLTFFYVDDRDFRGIHWSLPSHTFDLVTGFPDFDTLLWNTPCNQGMENSCANYRHLLVQHINQMNCWPEATGRITGYEIIRLSENERVLRFEFLRPNEPNLKYEFIGRLTN